jgi:hypothetical protein
MTNMNKYPTKEAMRFQEEKNEQKVPVSDRANMKVGNFYRIR